jgi:chlorite dismutase
VLRMAAVAGPPLIAVDRLAVLEGTDPSVPADSAWVLHGVTSYERYVHRTERSELVARQAPLGRPEATRAALIPISKSAAWWELSQDQRRAIFEEHSHHTATGLEYLPAIARRLHHARDLGGPFDFLTWFEYAPASSEQFEELVGRLRETAEWGYVEREIDIRLALEDRARSASEPPYAPPPSACNVHAFQRRLNETLWERARSSQE